MRKEPDLDVEAKSSIFIWPHLDWDQVVVGDGTVQLGRGEEDARGVWESKAHFEKFKLQVTSWNRLEG